MTLISTSADPIHTSRRRDLDDGSIILDLTKTYGVMYSAKVLTTRDLSVSRTHAAEARHGREDASGRSKWLV
jgi:hypothetical protein